MKTQGNMPLKIYSKNSLVTDFTPAQMKYTTKNILNVKSSMKPKRKQTIKWYQKDNWDMHQKFCKETNF